MDDDISNRDIWMLEVSTRRVAEQLIHLALDSSCQHSGRIFTAMDQVHELFHNERVKRKIDE